MAGLVGTDGVEVAEQGHVQGGVCLADIGQDALGHGLRGAIGVGGGTHGEVLGDGHTGRVAVNGGRGAEDKVLAAVAAHHIQNDQGAVEVVIVVFNGLGDTLAHSLVGCKLDDRGDIRALGEDLLHILMLGHIGLIEAEVLARDLLDPLQHHRRSVIVVIGHHHIVASVQQFNAGVAANVASAAGNQNCHCKNLSLVTIVAFFVRALPLLPKEYRFLHAESSTAHFMRLDSCCIFFRTMMKPQIFLHPAHGGKTLFVQMRERSPGTQKWPPGRAAIPFSLFKGVRTGVR